MDSKELSTIINNELKVKWYKKKWLTWNINFEDIIWVVNFQKSLYWNQYYINIGLFLKNIDQKITFAKIEDCLLSFTYRLEKLYEGSNIPKYIDIDEKNIKITILNIIQDNVLVFFDQNSTIQNIYLNIDKWILRLDCEFWLKKYWYERLD